MPTRTLTRPVDTMTHKVSPAKSFPALTYFETAANTSHGWLYWPLPFARNVKIVSAKLVLHSWETTPVSRTITVRRVASSVNFSRVTWNNQPGVAGASATASSSTSGPGQRWEFDVSAIMQEVADGAPWWGFRVSSSSSSALRWHATQSPYASSRPSLEIEWSDEPDPPSDLAPSGGLAVSTSKPIVRWLHPDQTALQVQTSASPTFATVAWDSGEVPSTLPELDLAATTFPGFTGTASYWRVRVRNLAGYWSGYSTPSATRYVERGVAAFVEPVGSTLMDSTPVVSWTFTGATQERWRVLVFEQGRVGHVWDSGVRTNGDQEVTVDAGVLRDDRSYTFTLRVWDTVDRASVPWSPAYRQVSKTVWFDDDLAVPVPSALSASPRGEWPHVDLEWSAASTPDAFEVSRGSLILARLDPDDVRVAPGVYEWSDRSCPPLVAQQYRVRAVVNNRRSAPVSTWVTSHPIGVWLTTDTQAVCLSGVDQGSPTLGARESVHEVGGRVVVITDALRGHEGDWGGVLDDRDGITAKQWRDAFMAIRENPTGARLHMCPANVPVTLWDMRVRGDMSNPNHSYLAAFSYAQQPGPELDAIDTVG